MSGFQKILRPDRELIKTIGMVLGLIGSITLIVWVSANRLLTIQATQDQINATINLNRQVAQLRSQYLEANPETLETDFQHADQLLIQNFTHLAQWAQELQRQGNQWNLQMHYRILTAKQTPAPVEGLTVIPIEIHMSPRGTESAYRSYLQFLQTLEQLGPRVDIQEVTVIGDGEKATQLTVGLSLWMKTIDSVEL